MKTFNVKPSGIVTGGTVGYEASGDGQVTYDVNLVARYMFSNHAVKSHGVYQVNPSLLKSANVKAGTDIVIGKVKLSIYSVADKVARAHVHVEGWADGEAVVSLKSEIVELMSLTARGKVLGFPINLETA